MCIHVARPSHKPVLDQLEKMPHVESHLHTQLLCQLNPSLLSIKVSQVLTNERGDLCTRNRQRRCIQRVLERGQSIHTESV